MAESDDDMNEAILLSLRENFRDTNRYLNEDADVVNLRHAADSSQRAESPLSSDEDADLQAAIRASLMDVDEQDIPQVPQGFRLTETSQRNETARVIERAPDTITANVPVLNTPSKVWGELLRSRREEREKIERESMHFTCCQVKKAISKRDKEIVKSTD